MTCAKTPAKKVQSGLEPRVVGCRAQSRYTLFLLPSFLPACSVAQSCLTLCCPMDCSLKGFSVQWDFPGKNTRVGFPPSEYLPDPGIQPVSPALASCNLYCCASWEAHTLFLVKDKSIRQIGHQFSSVQSLNRVRLFATP